MQTQFAACAVLNLKPRKVSKMENQKLPKLSIDSKVLFRIREASLRAFHDIRGFGSLGAAETQTLVALIGLRDFLISQGIEPNFDINVKEIEIEHMYESLEE